MVYGHAPFRTRIRILVLAVAALGAVPARTAQAQGPFGWIETVVKSVRGVNAWVGGGWVLADALSADQLREVGFEFEIKVGGGGGGAPSAATCQVPAGSGVTCTISTPAGGGEAPRVGRFAAPSAIEVTVDDTVDVDAVYYDANGVPHMYGTGLTGQSLDATVAGFAGGKLAGLTKGRTFLRLSYAGLDTYILVTVVAKPPVFGPGELSIEMGIERLTGFRYTDPGTGATIAGTIQSLPVLRTGFSHKLQISWTLTGARTANARAGWRRRD